MSKKTRFLKKKTLFSGFVRIGTILWTENFSKLEIWVKFVKQASEIVILFG